MFLENKYTKTYYNIIKRAQQRQEILEYTEKHHIIPKSFGGSRSKKNLVKLTGREHYICHLLLCKMVDDPKKKRSMAFALISMKNRKNPQTNKKVSTIKSSRIFEISRKFSSELLKGENNPFYGRGYLAAGDKNHFYGKKHTKKTRLKMSKSHKGKQTGKDNPFYGKKHKPETMKLITEKNSIPIIVEFLDGTTKEFLNRNELGIYLGKSKEMGAKLVNYATHLWGKYNIKNITRKNEISKN